MRRPGGRIYLPRLREPAGHQGVFYIAGAIAGLAGAVTLGISLLRARVFPRWTAIVLFVAAAALPVGGALENLPPIVQARRAGLG